MKMENNILAPRDGQVKEIFAAEGDTVDSNAILLSMEEDG
jgi:biotin carboxyl carrier protein